MRYSSPFPTDQTPLGHNCCLCEKNVTCVQVDVQLKERIGMNVTKVMGRLDKLKPRVRSNANGHPMPVDRAVHDLIAAAQSESNLAKMSPTFLSFV